MNTKINLTYNGTKYVLEYNRESVKILENNGFKLNELLEKPLNNVELAFTGAFIKNHPKTSTATIDNIFALCRDKTKLVATLTKMIQECYDSLLDDPIEDDKGNVSWDVEDLSPKMSQ